MKTKTLNPVEKSARVRSVDELIASGLSLNKACAEAGVSPASYLRWKSAIRDGGGDVYDSLRPKKPSGRPSAMSFSEDDMIIARWHRLCKGSLDIAIHFYCEDAGADPGNVATLRKIWENALETGNPPAWPLSVRRLFHVTADEANRFRGAKAAQDSELITRRGMMWIDENGEMQDLRPGELWELDDYSTNQPFTYLDPETGELEVGRQVLAGMDVCTAGWLGFDMIGRPRDAYRGEDIVRFIGRLFRAHGVPRFLRLERGSWDSSFIHGIPVDGQPDDYRWGGLDGLCHIENVWKSKAKGTIESSFNPLQNWLAHAGRDLGRHAGEFEESAKAWRQAKSAASRPDPRALGFWEQSACAAAHESAAQIMNSRPRERRGHGERVAADDLRNRHGWHTSPLPESESWRLLPWKARHVVSNGRVIVNPRRGWPEMTFVVNGTEGHTFENGHVLLVACDPADPTAGAYICNGDKSAKNRHGWGFGECLIPHAPLLPDSPQIDLSGRRHGTLDLRRRAAAAAATEFRAIQAGAPGRREVSVFDGRGNTATAGNLEAVSRPEPKPVTTTATGRAGLAVPPPASRGGESDLSALLGNDRAARLAALEAAERTALESL